eukprot:TRINITY_DN12715_c0_g1_i2.p1 TRINITY_DN12715_c0_g1~~TRINITY_DN12715_c0_g1_i2.p1  ORF type:complete len:529 (-),score=106.81 TRINITY_DN12715_c0_g1_i2:115-1701(-)
MCIRDSPYWLKRECFKNTIQIFKMRSNKSSLRTPLEDVLNLPSLSPTNAVESSFQQKEPLQRKSSYKKLAKPEAKVKGLKKELEDCLIKLESGEFIRKLKENSYLYTRKKLEDFFDEHASAIALEIPKIRKLLLCLEKPMSGENQRNVLSEYKEILAKFCPPLFEVVRKDCLANLKAQASNFKEEKSVDKEMDWALEQLMDRAKELCSYIASDPLISSKENMATIKYKGRASEVLKEINEEFKKGIDGIKLMLKTRKDMHEKLVNQFMIRSSSTAQVNFAQSKSIEERKHSKEIANLTSKIKEADCCILAYKTQIVGLEKDKSELSDKLRQAENGLEAMKSIVEKAKLTKVENKVSEEAIRALSKTLKEQYESDIKSLKSEVEQLKAKNDKLQRHHEVRKSVSGTTYEGLKDIRIHEKYIIEESKKADESIDPEFNMKRQEEEQMTSRFGGMSDRCTENDTTIIIPKVKEVKLNKTVGDVAGEFSNNKQKLKDSIKEMKERIERITGRRKNSPMNSKRLSSNSSLSDF